jgi:hypothetical protein
MCHKRILPTSRNNNNNIIIIIMPTRLETSVCVCVCVCVTCDNRNNKHPYVIQNWPQEGLYIDANLVITQPTRKDTNSRKAK